MRGLSSLLLAAAIGLVTAAVAAPLLVELAGALLPLVIAVSVAAVVLRLVFVHTRRW